MRQTVVGVFDRYESAQRAASLLADSGFGHDAVTVTESSFGDLDESGTASSSAATAGREDTGVLGSIRNFFSDVFSPDDNPQEVGAYAEAVRRGGAVVKVDVEQEVELDRARETLQAAGAVDIDERVAEWKQSGWSPDYSSNLAADGALAGQNLGVRRESSNLGASAGTLSPESQPTMTAGSAAGQEVIPVVREELHVGKRAVTTGGVRVYARSLERPVQESLELREEHARIERHPVDRPATEAELSGLQDRTVEVIETSEQPVVSKTARVVEEVVVGKEATSHVENITDTVRHTEVEVENIAAGGRSLDAGYDDDHFRQDFTSRFASTGSTYDEYAPAYRYGHSMSNDSRYHGRRWEDVETDARSDWETRNPGSSWERFKDAVKHGWQRTTS